MDKHPLTATEIASLLSPHYVGTHWDILISYAYLLDVLVLGGGFVLLMVLWWGMRDTGKDIR